MNKRGLLKKRMAIIISVAMILCSFTPVYAAENETPEVATATENVIEEKSEEIPDSLDEKKSQDNIEESTSEVTEDNPQNVSENDAQKISENGSQEISEQILEGLCSKNEDEEIEELGTTVGTITTISNAENATATMSVASSSGVATISDSILKTNGLQAYKVTISINSATPFNVEGYKLKDILDYYVGTGNYGVDDIKILCNDGEYNFKGKLSDRSVLLNDDTIVAFSYDTECNDTFKAYNKPRICVCSLSSGWAYPSMVMSVVTGYPGNMINYVLNGGAFNTSDSAVAEVKYYISDGEEVYLPTSSAMKAGKNGSFVGWYKNAELTETAGIKLSYSGSNQTVYARWSGPMEVANNNADLSISSLSRELYVNDKIADTNALKATNDNNKDKYPAKQFMATYSSGYCKYQGYKFDDVFGAVNISKPGSGDTVELYLEDGTVSSFDVKAAISDGKYIISYASMYGDNDIDKGIVITSYADGVESSVSNVKGIVINSREFTVDYVFNSGSFTNGYTPKATKSFVENVVMPTSDKITRSGYTFTGWYRDAACTDLVGATLATEDYADVTVYAGWSKNYTGGGSTTTTTTSKTPNANTTPATVQGSAAKPLAGDLWTYNATTKKWNYGGAVKNAWAMIVNPYAKEGQPKQSWFFFDENGNMLTGWQWIMDADKIRRCYYLNPLSDGTLGQALLNTTTPDGYAVDANGAWIVNGKVQTK